MRKMTVFLCAIAGLHSAFSNEKITSINYVLGDYYFPYIDKNKADEGCLSAFVDNVFLSQGIKHHETTWLPWSIVLKSLHRSQDNNIVSFPWSKTKEREKDYLFSQALYTKNAYIWVLKQNIKTYNSLLSLHGKKVCAPSGYGIYGEIGTLINNKKIIRVTSLTMPGCFNQLKEQKVAAVYAGNDAVKNFKALSDNPHTFTRSFIAGHKTHYLTVSKKSPNAKQIIERFDKGLQQLKNSGKSFNENQCETSD